MARYFGLGIAPKFEGIENMRKRMAIELWSMLVQDEEE
jgi:hypothetical protein